MIKLFAFRWVPPFAQGLVRDLRVRWALEEAGLPYEESLIGFEDQSTPSYRQLQPFGQVPAYEEDGLSLFESGSIVMHIAERSEALMPSDPAGRARTKTWMFAALSSVEPYVGQLLAFDPQKDPELSKRGRPAAEALVKSRLGALAGWLGTRDYLEERFSAGDLLMTTVLRILRTTDMIGQFPVVEAYQHRCEARPAFQRALGAQMAAFAKHAPPPPPAQPQPQSQS